MANLAYFSAWSTETGARKPILDAKYGVPLLWLGLFVAGDVRDELDAGFAAPPGWNPEHQLQTYLWLPPGGGGREVYARRTKLLIAATGKEKLVHAFAKFATKFDDGGLIQATEIAWMMEKGVEAASLRETLRMLDDPATDPAKLVGRTGYDDTSEYADNMLVGWGTKLSASERKDGVVNRAANKAVRAVKQRNVQLAAAIESTPPDQRRAYASSGTFKVDDVVEHPSFGTGLVTKIVDAKKLEVLFADGVHILVHKP
jgi:hypothetical protein